MTIIIMTLLSTTFLDRKITEWLESDEFFLHTEQHKLRTAASAS